VFQFDWVSNLRVTVQIYIGVYIESTWQRPSEVSRCLGHCQVEALVCGPNLRTKDRVKGGTTINCPFRYGGVPGNRTVDARIVDKH